MYEPEEYDKAVDSALERGENVEQYLATRTGAESRVYVPKQVMDLSPEQLGCPHYRKDEDGEEIGLLRWDGYRGVFTCQECGAQLVVPELRESMGLFVDSE